MALVPPIDDDDAPPEVRVVYDEIRATRGSDYINDFWRVALANGNNRLANGYRIDVDPRYRKE